jgi:hypothetical protein
VSRGRPPKKIETEVEVKKEETPNITGNESQHDQILQQLQEKGQVKRARGRPKKEPTFMKNGIVTDQQIFQYVKKESIPAAELQRFLTMCDLLIESLNPKTLSETDIEEIALYYRDRIYMDRIYETFAAAEASDMNMVKQLESFNKSLEKKKENLGSRFIDKGKKREDLLKGKTLVDLLSEYEETPEKFDKLIKEHNAKIEESKKQFTNPLDYMERHIISGKS